MRAAALSLVLCSVLGGAISAQQPKRPAPRPPAKPAAPAPKPATPPAAKPAPLPPDLVVKSQYVSGDKTTVSALSSKGKRQRVDYGGEMSVIASCDEGKLIQIADQGQRFLTAPLDAPPVVEASSKPPRKGGTITVTRTVTITNERKEIFGQQARRATIVTTRTPSADACDKRSEKMETDGWYIDQPAAIGCTVPVRKPAFAVANNCRDDITYVDPDATAGFPLAYTAVTTSADSSASMTMTVTAFERQTLAESLFTVPEGYREVKTLADLTETVKKSGNIRVGVVPLSTRLKEKGDMSLQTLSDALVVSLNDALVDSVPLEATSAAAAIDEARAKKVDFLLVTEVTDLRKPQRGLVGRVTGAKDFGAKVDFLLVAPGGVTPVLSSSERSGASNVQLAVKTAQTAYRFATPMGLLGSRFNFMQTYMAMAGPGGATPAAPSSDPVINTLFQVLNTSTGADQPKEMAESADAAVASALEKEVAAVAARLKR